MDEPNELGRDRQLVTIEGRLVLQVFRLVVDKVNITRHLVSIYLTNNH